MTRIIKKYSLHKGRKEDASPQTDDAGETSSGFMSNLKRSLSFRRHVRPSPYVNPPPTPSFEARLTPGIHNTFEDLCASMSLNLSSDALPGPHDRRYIAKSERQDKTIADLTAQVKTLEDTLEIERKQSEQQCAQVRQDYLRKLWVLERSSKWNMIPEYGKLSELAENDCRERKIDSACLYVLRNRYHTMSTELWKDRKTYLDGCQEEWQLAVPGFGPNGQRGARLEDDEESKSTAEPCTVEKARLEPRRSNEGPSGQYSTPSKQGFPFQASEARKLNTVQLKGFECGYSFEGPKVPPQTLCPYQASGPHGATTAQPKDIDRKYTLESCKALIDSISSSLASGTSKPRAAQPDEIRTSASKGYPTQYTATEIRTLNGWRSSEAPAARELNPKQIETLLALEKPARPERTLAGKAKSKATPPSSTGVAVSMPTTVEDALTRARARASAPSFEAKVDTKADSKAVNPSIPQPRPSHTSNRFNHQYPKCTEEATAQQAAVKADQDPWLPTHSWRQARAAEQKRREEYFGGFETAAQAQQAGWVRRGLSGKYYPPTNREKSLRDAEQSRSAWSAAERERIEAQAPAPAPAPVSLYTALKAKVVGTPHKSALDERTEAIQRKDELHAAIKKNKRHAGVLEASRKQFPSGPSNSNNNSNTQSQIQPQPQKQEQQQEQASSHPIAFPKREDFKSRAAWREAAFASMYDANAAKKAKVARLEAQRRAEEHRNRDLHEPQEEPSERLGEVYKYSTQRKINQRAAEEELRNAEEDARKKAREAEEKTREAELVRKTEEEEEWAAHRRAEQDILQKDKEWQRSYETVYAEGSETERKAHEEWNAKIKAAEEAMRGRTDKLRTKFKSRRAKGQANKARWEATRRETEEHYAQSYKCDAEYAARGTQNYGTNLDMNRPSGCQVENSEETGEEELRQTEPEESIGLAISMTSAHSVAKKVGSEQEGTQGSKGVEDMATEETECDDPPEVDVGQEPSSSTSALASPTLESGSEPQYSDPEEADIDEVTSSSAPEPKLVSAWDEDSWSEGDDRADDEDQQEEMSSKRLGKQKMTPEQYMEAAVEAPADEMHMPRPQNPVGRSEEDSDADSIGLKGVKPMPGGFF